jgi:hypothetical protein
MERQVRWRCWIIALTIGSVFAQKAVRPNPAPNVQIVRVRTGYSCAWCRGGYVENETSVEAGSIVTVSRSLSEKRKYPDIKTKYWIQKQDWEDLQHFIDAEVLSAFKGAIGCPGCADRPVEWLRCSSATGQRRSLHTMRGRRHHRLQRCCKRSEPSR